MENPLVIHCPIKGVQSITPCPAEEVEPLLDFLRSNAPAAEMRHFPRGIVTPDGRLDLCKQDLGPEGCRCIIAALKGNVHVRSILLGTDAIGDSGADAVAGLVGENEHVEILYLGCNH